MGRGAGGGQPAAGTLLQAVAPHRSPGRRAADAGHRALRLVPAGARDGHGSDGGGPHRRTPRPRRPHRRRRVRGDVRRRARRQHRRRRRACWPRPRWPPGGASRSSPGAGCPHERRGHRRPARPGRAHPGDGPAPRGRHRLVDGLDGLSIGRLAADLSVSKAGVFAHFGSKEELQLATVHAAGRALRRRGRGPGGGGARGAGAPRRPLRELARLQPSPGVPGRVLLLLHLRRVPRPPRSRARRARRRPPPLARCRRRPGGRRPATWASWTPPATPTRWRSSSTRWAWRPTSTTSSATTRPAFDRAASAMRARLRAIATAPHPALD